MKCILLPLVPSKAMAFIGRLQTYGSDPGMVKPKVADKYVDSFLSHKCLWHMHSKVCYGKICLSHCFHGYCTDSCSSSSYCSLVTPTMWT